MDFNWGNIGSVLNGVGSAYGAYQQNKMSKKIFNMQRKIYDEEEARRKKNQARIDLGASANLGFSSATPKIVY